MRPEPILLTPGPTPVPQTVREAMARPLPHHRSEEFRASYAAVLDGLAQVFRTQSDVLLFTSSGTGAFESALVNLLAPGDRVLGVAAGVFGERWIAMAEALGAEVVPLRFEWGERPDPEVVAEAVAADPTLTLVTLVHSETSTGATADVRRIAELTRDRRPLLVVDAISSLGAAPLEADGWGLDVVVGGCQKALMTPPGLAFASVSERAWARAREPGLPRFSLDWSRTLAAQRSGPQAPFTPAITLVLGLEAALAAILEEGLEACIARTRSLGELVRGEVRAMGLELFSPDDTECSLVTAIRVPDGVDGDGIRRALRERHGIFVAGGQQRLAGRIWRLGQFGAITERDLRSGLEALRLELAR